MNEFLIVLDTPGIKKYVFESSSLKDIRGASAILDGLNRAWLLVDFEEQKFTPEKIKYAYEHFIDEISGLELSHFIFANGGSGMMIVKAENNEAIKLFEDRLQKFYREHTKGGAVQMMAWVEYKAENFQNCRAQAHWKLRRNRSKQNLKIVPNTPWARFDDELKSRRAEKFFRGAGDSEREKNKWVSEVSYTRKKYSQDRHRKVWQEYCESVGHDVAAPDSLEVIAGEGKNAIAVVYADGNSMGRYIKTKIHSPKDYAEFSRQVDSAVRQATFNALADIFGDLSEARFDIILLGGDDILLVLPPEYAGDFVLKTHKYFLEETKEKFSLSFGISVANCHSPFSQMVKQAEICLKNAKSETDNAGVDFHVNSSGFYPDVNEYREKEFENRDIGARLTCRPFEMDVFRKYLECARRLKKAKIPASRLYAIASTLKQGKNRGHIGWVTGVGRAGKKEQRKALLDSLVCWNEKKSIEGDECCLDHSIEPWHRCENGVFECGFHDILELYDLVN